MLNRSLSILLLEDDEEDYELVRRELYLDGLDHQFDFALTWEKSLAEGMNLLRKNRFDGILLDLSLPDSSGLISFRKLREISPDVPVVVLTGRQDENLALQLVENGVQDYLVKGKSPGLLSRTLVHGIQRAEIMSKLERAERTSRGTAIAKSAFFSSMSHEIRNPLTSVIGYAEALKGADLTESEMQNALAAILSNGRHLLQLINDTLDVSKIEAGELKVELSRDSLRLLLRDILQTFVGRAKEKNLVFSIELLPPIPASVETDFFRLKQILYNFISNAIKFTHEGFVKLTVKVDGEFLAFEIKDSGIGISDSGKEHLFKAFSQADVSTARQYGGSGLGLLISNQLATLLEGKIAFRSREGIGSVFTVSIPLREVGKSSLTKEISQLSDLEPTSEDATLALSGRVLVVDDLEDNRNLISLFLRKTGLTVEVAENGKIALDKARGSKFDLILLDMQMPVMDGHDVARALRADGATLPILAVTGSVREESLRECLTAGCDACLSKPFQRQQLLDIVLRFLSNKEAVAPTRSQQPTVRDDELEEVRRGFVRKLPKRLQELEEAIASKDLNRLKAEAHKLIGAGLFGYDELSHFGGILESLVIQEQTGGLGLMEALIKKVNSEVGRISLEEKTASTSETTERSEPGRSQIVILVADDDEANLKVVCRNLSVKGFVPVPARGLDEALKHCDEGSFALLVVALEMNKFEGCTIIERVREKLKRKVPVIAMSARFPSEIRPKVAQLEIQHLLPKPASRDQLFEAIDSLISATLAG